MSTYSLQSSFACISNIFAVASLPTFGLAPLKDLSGIIVNQNRAASGSLPGPNKWYYQEFYLPADYVRGTDPAERIIPDLDGFSICCAITAGYVKNATINWMVQHYVTDEGWRTLDIGQTIGAPADGQMVWFDSYFNKAITIDSTMLTEKFRIGFFCPPVDTITTNSAGIPLLLTQDVNIPPTLPPSLPLLLVKGGTSTPGANPAALPLLMSDTPVIPIQAAQYDGTTLTLPLAAIEIDLEPGVPEAFDYHGDAAFALADDAGDVIWGLQEGITQIFYTLPDSQGAFTRAYLGDSPLTDENGKPISFRFRVFASTADDGTDPLGNKYRSAARRESPLFTQVTNDNPNRFWFSKPNPSQFAVESLYFDLRDFTGKAKVIDRMVLDPITPGVAFNVYYSNSAGNPQSEHDWEELIWKHVPVTYVAKKRDTYGFPKPITANFVKVEFQQLQAANYNPGDFAKPVKYKKHPKWVLDYFVIVLDEERRRRGHDWFVATSVDVTFDAYDLLYNYYLSDLGHEPDRPLALDPSQLEQVNQFLQTPDTTGQLDAKTAAQISTMLYPYQNNPIYMSTNKSIFGLYTAATYFNANSVNSKSPAPPVPTEGTAPAPYVTAFVSSTDRDALIIEGMFPITYFFVDCRHRYKEVMASFDNNRAYFVGVREITFLRDRYDATADQSQYIETAGDNTNVERNDFEQVDFTWTTYSP